MTAAWPAQQSTDSSRPLIACQLALSLQLIADSLTILFPPISYFQALMQPFLSAARSITLVPSVQVIVSAALWRLRAALPKKSQSFLFRPATIESFC